MTQPLKIYNSTKLSKINMNCQGNNHWYRKRKHHPFLLFSHRPCEVDGDLKKLWYNIPTQLHNPHQQIEALNTFKLYNTTSSKSNRQIHVHFAIVKKKLQPHLWMSHLLNYIIFNITCVGFIVCFIVLKVIWGSKRTRFFQSCPYNFFHTVRTNKTKLL